MHLKLSTVSLTIIFSDVVAPIEREIRSLSNGLAAVKDEQEYIVLRERTHRNTAESTNDRVKWWSVVQAIVLFLVCAWQVYYLKVNLMVTHDRLVADATSSPVLLRSKACNLTTYVTYALLFCNKQEIDNTRHQSTKITQR